MNNENEHSADNNCCRNCHPHRFSTICTLSLGAVLFAIASAQGTQDSGGDNVDRAKLDAVRNLTIGSLAASTVLHLLVGSLSWWIASAPAHPSMSVKTVLMLATISTCFFLIVPSIYLALLYRLPTHMLQPASLALFFINAMLAALGVALWDFILFRLPFPIPILSFSQPIEPVIVHTKQIAPVIVHTMNNVQIHGLDLSSYNSENDKVSHKEEDLVTRQV